jgi:hypothetical protein
MFLETVGHASLYLTNYKEEPLFLTDPWFIGSSYWRSWWLQNYPSREKLKQIYKTNLIYITHEHPDHFHLPTLRNFNENSKLLIPDFPNKKLTNFLNENKNFHEIIKRNKWKLINYNEKISILSIPLWNDDSILLVETPNAIIVNLNDSKPFNFTLNKIKKFLKTSCKKSIVLSSYSPASIANSFRLNEKVLSIKSKIDYINYINKICNYLEADFFMPFASQAIFQRKDSLWANEFKVSYEDLLNGFKTNKTSLLPCYSKINLDNFNFTYVKKENYNIKSNQLINEKIKIQFEKESKYIFTKNDIDLLQKKISKINFYMKMFFRNSVGFKIDNKFFIYDRKKKTIILNKEITMKNQTDFIIEIPGLVLSDVLKNENLGDVGPSMFTIIHSRKGLDLRFVYLFFILIGLDDYGHTKTFFRTCKWFLKQISNYLSFYLKPAKYF